AIYPTSFFVSSSPTTTISTLSLHDALPIYQDALVRFHYQEGQTTASGAPKTVTPLPADINHHWTKALTASADGQYLYVGIGSNRDRKSTRLNSSHVKISYAVFCLKKKIKTQ